MRKSITIKDAKIGTGNFRNFSGEERKFNNAGKRNFCLFLEQDLADDLEEDGWNVRYLDPRDEGDDPIPYLSVAINYGVKPPKIVTVTSRGQTILDEEDIHILDWAEFEKVDLMINGSAWEINGKSGVKGYVDTMYITISENELELMYNDIPAIAEHEDGY